MTSLRRNILTVVLILVLSVNLNAQSDQSGLWIGVEGGTSSPVGHEIVQSGESLYLSFEYANIIQMGEFPINLGLEMGYQRFGRNSSSLGALDQYPYGIFINSNLTQSVWPKLAVKPGIFVGTFNGDFRRGEHRSEMLFGVSVPVKVDYQLSNKFKIGLACRAFRVFGFPDYSDTLYNDYVDLGLGLSYFIPIR